MSSSGADASDLDAALALLSGPQLVAHLRATCHRADYDAAAQVLSDRDRRLAHAERAAVESRAGLAELGAQVQALEERCLAYMGAANVRGFLASGTSPLRTRRNGPQRRGFLARGRRPRLEARPTTKTTQSRLPSFL